ncbi:MAG: type I methionyl aminopeptidase [Patescibacteria group bacterium]|mgnify:CR=1 FL=1
MANQKTLDEIAAMREGGHLLSSALQKAIDAVKQGVNIRDLDRIATEAIRAGGGEPSFLGYKSRSSDEGFPSTMCISVNDEVVHGSGARDVILKNCDLVGLDIGCWYKGLCTDMAVTVPVGGYEGLPKEHKTLLQVTRASMMAGIEAAKVDGYIHDISAAIEEYIKTYKFGIVRSLVGHGVGHKVHEDPHVPNFVSKDFPEARIVDRMCLAIEPMVTLGGDYHVETAEDGWTIRTVDRSWAAHFELTIAVTEAGVEILTLAPNVGF